MHWIHLAQTLALTGATVHTMNPDAAVEVATVLVEDGRITAIGADLEIPEGAEVLDLEGLHLVPGLIDAYASHDPDHDVLYRAAGVTLIRDTGGHPPSLRDRRPLEARDEAQGPLLFTPGAPIDGRPPATTESLIIPSSGYVEEYLPKYIESVLPDYLALGPSLDPDSWRTLVAFAADNGLMTWGPVPRQVSFGMALAGGQSGFSNLQGLLPDGKGWHQLESLEPLEANLAAMEANPRPITPLLGVYARMLERRGDEKDTLELLAPHYRPNWAQEARTWKDQVQGEVRELTQRTLEMQGQIVKRWLAAGVPVLPGSAAPNSWLLPGTGLIDELQLWEQAGVPAYEVLAAATRNAAQALGVQADHGTLSVGAFADVLALGLDPRDGTVALRDPEVVVLRGRVHERPDLEDAAEELRVRQRAAWEELLAPVDVAMPDLGEAQLLLSGRAETRAAGLRIQSEHFAVGRRADGAMIYATRLETPATVTGAAASQTHLLQEVRSGRLQSFDMTVSAEGREFQVQGRKLGGLLNVEARVDGNFVYNERARESVSMVDVGTGLSAVLVGSLLEPGDNFVLGFEDISPRVHRWRMKVDERDHQHIVDAGVGYCWFGVEATGAPLFGLRQEGNTRTELVILEVQTGGGPGLGVPAERVFLRDQALEGSAGK